MTELRGGGHKVRDSDASEEHVLPKNITVGKKRVARNGRRFNTAFAHVRCNNDRNRAGNPVTACLQFFAREAWVAWDAYADVHLGDVFVERPRSWVELIEAAAVRAKPVPTAMQLAFEGARRDNVKRQARRTKYMQTTVDSFFGGET